MELVLHRSLQHEIQPLLMAINTLNGKRQNCTRSYFENRHYCWRPFNRSPLNGYLLLHVSSEKKLKKTESLFHARQGRSYVEARGGNWFLVI